MTLSKLMALAPILILSITIIVLVLHASLKRDHKSAWYVSALGLLITIWGSYYASGYAQQVTVLLKVDNWGLLFSALIVVSIAGNGANGHSSLRHDCFPRGGCSPARS